MKALSPQQISRLQSMFASARQAHQGGLYAQAEVLYRDILKGASAAYEVHHHLAILLAETNRAKEAAKHFQIIVKANPAHATSHVNLANALADSGALKEAIVEYRRAISLDPKLGGAYMGLGAIFRKQGAIKEAIASYKRALDLDKVNHAAFNGLGLAYRDIEDFPRALECFEHAVGLAWDNADYRLNFGVTLRKCKLIDLAAGEFQQVVKLRPTWLEAIVLLAEVLQEQRRFDEAKECLKHALRLDPDKVELSERLGHIYLEMGDVEQAIRIFENVLASHPDRFVAMRGLGRSKMADGRITEAAALFEHAVQQFPTEADAYYFLADSKKFKLGDPIIQQLEELSAGTAIGDDKAAISINFALGKIYDDCKQWDAAFERYANANKILNKEYDYQRAVEEAKYAELATFFNQEFFEKYSNFGVESNLPILIIGMPRSGTTLTEQIISSHPKVKGAGEVVFWGYAPQAIPHALNTELKYPECILQLTAEKAHEIAQKYEQLLYEIAGREIIPTHITDKLPHNFIHLGLIALLFPKAPIIHCKRDPMDNCLSIFFQNFAGIHSYAYDLSNIGHHYKQYERLMAHWHSVLPGRIFDINYEDMITDPECWSRKLIEHVGLEWSNSCLAPHKLERTVRTASHWQVRQPIYKTSLKRWRNYEKHLGPLKDALGIE